MAAGENSEKVARWTIARRNRAKVESRVQTPPAITRFFEQRNLRRYGDKVGPTYEYYKDAERRFPKPPKSDADIVSGAGRTSVWINRLTAVR